MANQVEIEEVFSEHFQHHPKLKICYFIINSLFDRNLFEFLDCRQLAKTLRTSFKKVTTAAKHLQQCCPDVVIYTCYPNYRETFITKLGEEFLHNDIRKFVPQDGISLEELKKITYASTFKTCVQKNWLVFEKSADKYLPGKNFSDYVRLYTALNKYKQTKDLTNQQDLVAQKYIQIIKERHEIRRGTLFPSDVNGKLFVLYEVAEYIYKEMLEDLQASSNHINRFKNWLRAHQQNVCDKIKSHNERRCFLKERQEKLMIIQSQMNSWRQNYALPEQSVQPQSPPDIIPLPKQVPQQPQNQGNLLLQPLSQLPNQQMQHRPLPQENKRPSQKRGVTEQPHYFGKQPRIEPQGEYNPSLQSASQFYESLEEQQSSTHRQHVTQQANYSGQQPQSEFQGQYNPLMPSASQLSQSLEEQHLPTHQQNVMLQANYPRQWPQVQPQGEHNPWLPSSSEPTHLLNEQHLPTHQQGVIQQAHYSRQRLHTEPYSEEDLLLPSISQPSSSCHTLERKDKW